MGRGLAYEVANRHAQIEDRWLTRKNPKNRKNSKLANRVVLLTDQRQTFAPPTK